jgi:TetR/AcrR family transcriptional regulator
MANKATRATKPAVALRSRPADKQAPAKPTQARTLVTRKRILAAAVAEFSKHGYAGTSIRGIARKARVPDPLIHYHFGGKEKLWREAVTALFDEMHADNDKAAEGATDKLDEVRRRLHALLYYLARKPELSAFTTLEYGRKSPRLSFIIKTFYGKRFNDALEAIGQLQGAGRLPAGDTQLLNSIMIGLAHLLSQRGGEIELLTGRSAKDSALIEDYWRFVDGILFGAVDPPR